MARTRGWKNYLLGAAIFALSILIGAILALGLRSYRGRTEPVATKPPEKTAPAPSVVIESPKEPDDSAPNASEKSSSKGTIKPEKKEPVIEKPPIVAERPPIVTARPPALPPPVEDIPDVDTDEDSVSSDRGIIAIRFRLSGEALVRIRGADASVIPLAGSTIGDVKRNIRQPLPAQPCRVKIRQRSISNVIATVEEEPSSRNNYTATIRVTSTYPDLRQEVMAGFVLVWRLI
jgi:hypothetical protein